jgi:hypothetical protein
MRHVQFLAIAHVPGRMKRTTFPTRFFLAALKRFVQIPFVLLAVLLPALASPLEAEVTPDDVLSIQDGRFFLDGHPFAEISFNKFDLLWQLYGELAAGRTLDAANPMVQAQDRALRDLHEMGFRTIRIFALPWGPGGPAAYADPDKRQMLYAALDKTVELCERYEIRLVWSLGAATFTDTRLEPGKGWVFGEEQERELISNPESRGRRLLYQYRRDGEPI